MIEEMVRELAARWCLSRIHGRGVPEGMPTREKNRLLACIANGDRTVGIEPGDERLAAVEHYLRWNFAPAAVEANLRLVKAYALVRENLDGNMPEGMEVGQ